MQLTGLHHLTAVTADAPGNFAFYSRVLGMRLVKKTVNQDDVTAYHLFYGDAVGSPGTEITFFDWAQMGPHVPGSGDISGVALRVNGHAALEWWRERLVNEGLSCGEIGERGGRTGFDFADREGQRLRLVDDGGAAAGPVWQRSPVPAEHAIRGMDSVQVTVRRLLPTETVLMQVMGMRREQDYERDGHRVAVFAMVEGGPGAELHVEERPDLARTSLGAGGVHHVAFRTPNIEEQSAWMQRIRSAGLRTSELIDRFYFNSLYFREPNGILFEIATDGPGFATDEDPARLGEALALPPFLEPRRRQIEAGLRPLNTATT